MLKVIVVEPVYLPNFITRKIPEQTLEGYSDDGELILQGQTYSSDMDSFGSRLMKSPWYISEAVPDKKSNVGYRMRPLTVLGPGIEKAMNFIKNFDKEGK